MDCKDIKFATRSFIDEFYNLFLKDASSLPFKVEITNVPEDIQAMITSVSKTQTKVKTIRPTSNVLNFENVDDLLKYMSTVAFYQNKKIYRLAQGFVKSLGSFYYWASSQ